MKKHLLFLTLLSTCTLLTACYTPASHYQHPSSDKNLTLGTAQKELKKGMSQAKVVEALGSPNMVTMDRDGVETWVYDRSSREFITTQNKVGAWVLFVAGEGQQASGKTTQRTLTLILKFRDGVLTELTYNSTSF